MAWLGDSDEQTTRGRGWEHRCQWQGRGSQWQRVGAGAANGATGTDKKGKKSGGERDPRPRGATVTAEEGPGRWTGGLGALGTATEQEGEESGGEGASRGQPGQWSLQGEAGGSEWDRYQPGQWQQGESRGRGWDQGRWQRGRTAAEEQGKWSSGAGSGDSGGARVPSRADRAKSKTWEGSGGGGPPGDEPGPPGDEPVRTTVKIKSFHPRVLTDRQPCVWTLRQTLDSVGFDRLYDFVLWNNRAVVVNFFRAQSAAQCVSIFSRFRWYKTGQAIVETATSEASYHKIQGYAANIRQICAEREQGFFHEPLLFDAAGQRLPFEKEAQRVHTVYASPPARVVKRVPIRV